MLFTDWFEPAYKAGGPIRSCVNFAYHMRGDYDIYVFTGDRDLGDEEAMDEIITDQWIPHSEGLAIYYASRDSLNWRVIGKQIRGLNADYIYLNSMFSRYFTVYPLLVKLYSRTAGKVVLAPRGMLRRSALSFKPFKKKLFLNLFSVLKITRFITFHATDEEEKKDILQVFGKDASSFSVPNFPGFQKPLTLPLQKRAGELKMVFVGRIHPIKNLHFLLEGLRACQSHIYLTVIGVKEDPDYWDSCKELVKQLPLNIIVVFIDAVPHHQLENILVEHHLFVLPTQGENFGHAIFEALAAGRPVLISDQTPWKNLEPFKAGWDLSLNDITRFAGTIERVAYMSAEELNDLCQCAWQYCSNYIQQSNIKQQYLKLFN